MAKVEILVSCTYYIVTPESAALGDFAECGMEWEARGFSFRELVDLLFQNWSEPSDSHEAYWTDHTWLTGPSDTDYRTCAETRYSYHFSRGNNPRLSKYWVKALIAARDKRRELNKRRHI